MSGFEIFNNFKFKGTKEIVDHTTAATRSRLNEGSDVISFSFFLFSSKKIIDTQK